MSPTSYSGITATADGIIYYKGRQLKPRDNGRGYLKVDIPIGNKKFKSRPVHRLVAEAFLPNPKSLPIVDHKDGDKHNNCVDNLQWVTHKRNMALARQQTQMQRRPIAKISKSGTVVDVFFSINKAAKYLGYDYRGLFAAVQSGKKYKGARWAYIDFSIKEV